MSKTAQKKDTALTRIPAGFTRIGVIGVDAGICWIGDPCYILHTDQMPKMVGRNWQEFCNELEAQGLDAKQSMQFDFDLGGAGLGVVTRTGHGDGCYPVYASFDRGGCVAQVLIDYYGAEDPLE